MSGFCLFVFVLSEGELAVVHPHLVGLITPFKSLGDIQNRCSAKLSAKGGRERWLC